MCQNRRVYKLTIEVVVAQPLRFPDAVHSSNKGVRPWSRRLRSIAELDLSRADDGEAHDNGHASTKRSPRTGTLLPDNGVSSSAGPATSQGRERELDLCEPGKHMWGTQKGKVRFKSLEQNNQSSIFSVDGKVTLASVFFAALTAIAQTSPTPSQDYKKNK